MAIEKNKGLEGERSPREEREEDAEGASPGNEMAPPLHPIEQRAMRSVVCPSCHAPVGKCCVSGGSPTLLVHVARVEECRNTNFVVRRAPEEHREDLHRIVRAAYFAGINDGLELCENAAGPTPHETWRYFCQLHGLDYTKGGPPSTDT